MGEIYAQEASSIQRRLSGEIDTMKANIRMNFNDMDFENAKQREEIEELIRSMETICANCKSELDGLSFS